MYPLNFLAFCQSMKAVLFGFYDFRGTESVCSNSGAASFEGSIWMPITSQRLDKGCPNLKAAANCCLLFPEFAGWVWCIHRSPPYPQIQWVGCAAKGDFCSWNSGEVCFGRLLSFALTFFLYSYVKIYIIY